MFVVLTTWQVFTIASDELQDASESSLGKKQSVYNVVATETQTTISRTVSKDRSVTISVTGKAKDVEKARAELTKRLQQKVSVLVFDVWGVRRRFVSGSKRVDCVFWTLL